MVLFGVKCRIDGELIKAIQSFNDNLLNGSVAGIFFTNDSFIELLGDKGGIIVYLKPLFPRAIIYYVSVLLAIIATIFKSSIVLIILLILWGLFLSIKPLITWAFIRGLRKQNYTGEVKIL